MAAENPRCKRKCKCKNPKSDMSAEKRTRKRVRCVDVLPNDRGGNRKGSNQEKCIANPESVGFKLELGQHILSGVTKCDLWRHRRCMYRSGVELCRTCVVPLGWIRCWIHSGRV